MAAKPDYEELLRRVQELEAEKVDHSRQNTALKKLFNLSLDMLCVADFDGYFRIINSAFVNTLGHSEKALLETPFFDFVHPDDKTATHEALAGLRTGEPISYFENRYRCKDGSYKWLAWTSVPVTEEGLLYAVAHDISGHKAVQHELSAQRDLLGNILSNVPASIFWKDRNSVYLGGNEKFARDAGLESPDKLIGKSDYDLAWTREESDSYRECDRKVMDSGEAMLNIEESQHQDDGKSIDLLTNKVPLLDASGQAYGMLGIYMDISKRKQTENSLRKSEAYLQTLFDSAAEFIFVIDPEGKINKANRFMYEQTGYKTGEVLGNNIKEFFPGESQDKFDCTFPAPRKRGYKRADIEFVCKDGRILQMEFSVTEIPAEKQDSTAFLIILRDMTERNRAATTLAISEQRFRTIFNSSYQLIGILDTEGRLLDANQTALDVVGLGRKDVIGVNFWEIYCWSYSTRVQRRLRDAIRDAAEGKPVRYEEELLTADNVIRTIDFTLKPVLNQQDETVLLIPEGRDITELKRAEEETQRHHQEIAHVTRLNTAGEMASGMAHELNQPLTALTSYCGTALSLVNSMSSPPPRLSDILERATEQAQRAGDIIRHLREFVSKGNDQIVLTDLQQVILDVIAFLKHEARQGDVNIAFYPGCQKCRVKADKIQIEQVLINLVRNSMEAIQRAKISAGQIILKTRILPNDNVEVTVTDNGPGIDAKMTGTIFNPFQTNKETGMGLGLSLSRTIIETHGGNLWLDKDYGNGALFGFELPVSK